MSAGCLRWLLSHAVRGVCAGGPGSWSPASRGLIMYSERYNNMAASWRGSLFSTTADDSEESPAPKKKKQDPRARANIGSIGRKIQHRLLQVISDTGENLGTMHRADAIRLMDEKDLKLVILREHSDPPVYRLMSGKQIHEEQMKLREKQKDKAGPVQVKELTFSSDIAAHDLRTKLKQVQSWLDKKHHVRLTIRSRRGQITESLDTVLEQIVEQIEVMVGFVSKPKVVRDGQAAMCVLRPPSKKELSLLGQNKHPSVQTTDSSSSQPTDPSSSQPTEPTEPTNTSSDSPTEKTTEPTNTSSDSPTEKTTEPTNTSSDSPTEKTTKPTNTSSDSPTEKTTEPTNTSSDSPTEKTTEPTNTSSDSPTEKTTEPTNTSSDSPTEKTTEPTNTSSDSPTDKT